MEQSERLYAGKQPAPHAVDRGGYRPGGGGRGGGEPPHNPDPGRGRALPRE